MRSPSELSRRTPASGDLHIINPTWRRLLSKSHSGVQSPLNRLPQKHSPRSAPSSRSAGAEDRAAEQGVTGAWRSRRRASDRMGPERMRAWSIVIPVKVSGLARNCEEDHRRQAGIEDQAGAISCGPEEEGDQFRWLDRLEEEHVERRRLWLAADLHSVPHPLMAIRRGGRARASPQLLCDREPVVVRHEAGQPEQHRAARQMRSAASRRWERSSVRKPWSWRTAAVVSTVSGSSSTTSTDGGAGGGIRWA